MIKYPKLNNSKNLKNDTKLSRFFEILSLCHTVQKDNTEEHKYQASSPDEMCFINFCLKLGIIYMGDQKLKNTSSSNKTRTVKFLSSKKSFEIMQILEFDSNRKRMSIILKNLDSQEYILYCKGADSSILANCVSGDIQSCESDIKSFGQNGWRTLALGYRLLSHDEYKTFEQKLLDAYVDIINRNSKVSSVFEELESSLILAGATAIEDKLQEDVASTLQSLRVSGIKIWVLTGDKTETAINISHSCKHFSESMIKFHLTEITDQNKLKSSLGVFNQK